ncbi:hypothetical protein D3C76_1745270 [compost metagenome]
MPLAHLYGYSYNTFTAVYANMLNYPGDGMDKAVDMVIVPWAIHRQLIQFAVPGEFAVLIAVGRE